MMVHTIFNDIYSAFIQSAPLAMITGGVFLMLIYLIISSLSRKNESYYFKFRPPYLILYILYCYCFIVVSITILSREPGSRDRMDLKLFSTFSPVLSDNIYPIENIILFIPLGILLPLIGKVFQTPYTVLGIGLGFSLLIELLQNVTKRGFFQTDDIMTNVIGTAIGYFAIKYIKKLCRSFRR